ncbi:signal peptidase II, partial [Rhodococcus sp. NPDC080181]|uniref:signal peptidase II n=1 Tax=Rhodococcus sp. NPDC080181 TaxID=3155292 RepID=UPI003450A741
IPQHQTFAPSRASREAPSSVAPPRAANLTALRHGEQWTTVALALILAGALSNVLDRLVDGAVTDYFHTGWWPTFNLADIYITCGVVLMIGAALARERAQGLPLCPQCPTAPDRERA